MLSLSLLALCYLNELVGAQSTYAAIPRWGQAVALVQNTLYIQGGRTDPYNSFSYSSAPPNNDLLSLSLTSSFNPSSPSFEYIGGCSNCSSSQGPAVAWHTLTPFSTSGLLLFGGDPGPNSQVVLPSKNDSSVLLSLSSPENATWDYETEGWANEPMRRMYHSAVSAQGKVWIVGGEKADDSGSAFSQHYVFDPNGPSFAALPSANGPADITGHQSVLLSDGRMLVFGGYSPSEKSLIPFSTVWALDLTHPDAPSWSLLSISTSSIPPPRRNFAATVLDSGKVLIHGGADASLQNSLADGWILDTTQSPMVWTNVTALTQLGPRRDHFAVGLGSLAILGFGYAQSGAASASLAVFDSSSGTFQSTYTPPPAVTSPTATTLAGPTQTGAGGSPSGTNAPGSAEFPQPSHTGGGHPSGTGNGNGNGGDPSATGAAGTSHATAIAVGTVFGVLALVVGAVGASWYIRRRHSQQRFHLLGESGDEESPHGPGPIPVAGMAGYREKGLPLTPVVRTVRDRLSRVVPGMAMQQDAQERRDMLADEDTREFDGWYHVRDPSTGQESQSSRRRPTLEKVYDSLASLRSVGGAMLDYAAGAAVGAAAVAGARGTKSREASASSKGTMLDDVLWSEKRGSYNPYTDDLGTTRYAAPSLNASRPRGGRQASSYSYVDPFEDAYEVESLNYDPEVLYRDEDDDKDRGYPSLLDPPPPTRLQTMRSPGMLDVTRLTPVSERSSVPTLTDPASTSESSLSILPSPLVASSGHNSSSSSHEPPQSPRRPSSIIDANPSSSYVKRSNSWWTRFAKTPLLDRRSSSASRTPRPLDFRDPNPPPRLVPIEESQHSMSPDSPEGRRRTGSSGAGHAQRFSTHHHGRSASSLQTAQTANSEQLERVAQTMQIVRKEGSTASSAASAVPSREGSGGTVGELGDLAARAPQETVLGSPSRADALVMSPTHMTREEQASTSTLGELPPRVRPPPPERRASKVAERVQAYERRMSLQESPSPPRRTPPAVPPRNRLSSTYGLAPKPSLYVANPDHRHKASDDS